MQVRSQIKPGDLIVMSDFLHCVEDPAKIIKAFPDCAMAILEYIPTNIAWAESYMDQLKRYGGNPFSREEFGEIIIETGRNVYMENIGPYVLALVNREGDK